MPKFRTDRTIKRLALPITRICNRHCPECPAREREGVSGPPVSISELEWVGKTIGPIDKIEVTGGEPSLHPEFPWISEHIHELFQSKDIMLLTNGWLFDDDASLPLLLHWDRVYVTHYTQAFADRYGTPTNTVVHDRIRDYLAGHPEVKFWSQTMDSHVPFDKPLPWSNGCRYDYDKGDMVSYNRGQLYGCCTAWELDYRGKGILLTPDWRSHLGEIELPCDTCFLGIAVER